LGYRLSVWYLYAEVGVVEGGSARWGGPLPSEGWCRVLLKGVAGVAALGAEVALFAVRGRVSTTMVLSGEEGWFVRAWGI